MLEYMNKNGYSNVTKFNRLVSDSFFWDQKERNICHQYGD